jgi:hypothetical protein
VFKKGSEYFINIRPDCDCIAREGKNQDDVEMYLLQGSKLSPAGLASKANGKYGTVSERDTEAIIFGMFETRTFAFQFKDLTVGKWADWKARRIGRLLPPFLTRLQQRYAAYLQRPGLSRIPSVLLPIPVALETVVPVAEPEPSKAVVPETSAISVQDPVVQPVAEPPVVPAADAEVETKPKADLSVENVDPE